MLTLSSEVQFSKVLLPSCFAMLGMVSCFSEAQSWKARSPSLVRPSGSSMVASDLHSLNALLPMVFTDGGRLTLERLVHLANISVPMDCRLPLRLTLASPAQFSKALLPILLTRSISTELRLRQPLKASLPMVVAVVISMLSSDWQSSKALLPISLMASGICMLSSDLHPLNASVPMSVTDPGRLMLLRRSQRRKVALLMVFSEVSCSEMRSNALQLAKAPASITSTDSGMSMLARAMQPSKARF